LGCGERHAEALVAHDGRDAALEEILGQREIEEPRARDLDALANAGEIDGGHDGLGDLPRRAAQRLREPHREIGLKVRAVGAAHHRVDVRVLGTESVGDRTLKPRREDGSRVVSYAGHGKLPMAFEEPIRGFSTAGSRGSRPRSIRRGAPVSDHPPERRLTHKLTRDLVQSSTRAGIKNKYTALRRVFFAASCRLGPVIGSVEGLF
jgi:hypothetical protein